MDSRALCRLPPTGRVTESSIKQDPLLRSGQVATWLGVSRRTIRLWAELRAIPGFKLGHHWRFREEEVRSWIDVHLRASLIDPCGDPARPSADSGELEKTGSDQVTNNAAIFDTAAVENARKPVGEGRVTSTPQINNSACGLVTTRESQILQLLRDGQTTKGIAGRLHLSCDTVATYRKQLCKKLGVHSAAELIVYACRYDRA